MTKESFEGPAECRIRVDIFGIIGDRWGPFGGITVRSGKVRCSTVRNDAVPSHIILYQVQRPNERCIIYELKRT